ncbi:hypothetical protein HanRHA438_Chr02g0086271 [Helianthus annuus]|nr:hypothetical protein HanRHA438_Chr02g0086271 [Helianthus annuus]
MVHHQNKDQSWVLFYKLQPFIIVCHLYFIHDQPRSSPKLMILGVTKGYNG